MKELLLEVKNVVVEFQTEDEVVTAVDGISFSLRRGETIGIVGESGSGKSVSALSAMGLIPSPPGRIVSGQITYHSKEKGPVDLVQLPADEMRKLRGNELAMIFQEPMTSLNPVITCGNQVVEAIMLHQKIKKKDAEQKTLELFKKVKLPRPEHIMTAYPHQISGGQKQRVMIAMAMSCNPNILIADEPTTALDVTVQKTILDLMLDLQREKEMSILFITHDLGVIAELADKVVVMYKGKIVEQGSVLDIFNNPQHPYTKGLLACRPPLDVRLKHLPTINDFMEVDAAGAIVEKEQTVNEALYHAEITTEERKQWHTELYSRPKILEVKNVKTYFPVNKSFFGKPTEFVKAVDDVSFDVYEGETLGLVGESGCGKTTLGRTILRLVEPTAGLISFKKQDITALPANEMRALRSDMQIIFQDPYSSLNPQITVGEAIIEPMRVHNLYKNDKERKEKAMDLLRRVNLTEKQFYRYPHEFSGGQRQRVCIARALALSPHFIICDESVSALDVSVQAQVLNLLNDLKKEFKFTYIFISHNLSVVKFMSDRMIVMNKGQIEEMGDADDICDNPQSEYTCKLINSIPKGRMEDIIRSIENKKKLAF
ncbi:MAG: ABC transporter ATP-binding protein [Bacteroidetes bacterium]|nr:ABC transporter ATP-binding protein [Bacteroidota bacterium]